MSTCAVRKPGDYFMLNKIHFSLISNLDFNCDPVQLSMVGGAGGPPGQSAAPAVARERGTGDVLN